MPFAMRKDCKLSGGGGGVVDKMLPVEIQLPPQKYYMKIKQHPPCTIKTWFNGTGGLAGIDEDFFNLLLKFYDNNYFSFATN